MGVVCRAIALPSYCTTSAAPNLGFSRARVKEKAAKTEGSMCGEPWTPSWPEPGQSYQKGPCASVYYFGEWEQAGLLQGSQMAPALGVRLPCQVELGLV